MILERLQRQPQSPEAIHQAFELAREVFTASEGHKAVVSAAEELRKSGFNDVYVKVPKRDFDPERKNPDYEMQIRWDRGFRSDHDIYSIPMTKGVRVTASAQNGVTVSVTGQRHMQDAWINVERHRDYPEFAHPGFESSLAGKVDFAVNMANPLWNDDPGK